VAGLLFVGWISALGEAGVHSTKSDRIKQVWQSAVVAVGHADRIKDLRMPKVIFEKPPQSLVRSGDEVYGFYNHFINTVTISPGLGRAPRKWGQPPVRRRTTEEVLVHEFCHAVLFQTEGLAAMHDEARVRGLTMKAGGAAKGGE
jgi:hypothetical protein